MRRIAPFQTALIVASALCAGMTAAPAAAQEAKGVLVLQTYGQNNPGRLPFDAAFTRTMQAATDLNLDLYVEAIDANRFGDAQVERTRAYLLERYADKHISLIVAVYDRALTFLLAPGAPLFPNARIAAVLSARPESLPDRVAAIWEGNTFADTVSLALKLQPQTRQIAVIDAAFPSQGSRTVRDEAVRQVERAAQGRPILRLFDVPLDELRVRVQSLPPDVIIVVVRQLVGAAGAATNSIDAVSMLAPIASAPIYVISDRQIGSGAVGGVVSRLDIEGERLAQLALSIVRNPSLHPPLVESSSSVIVDWRALQKWGLEEARLPPGSDVRFRQLSAWQQYRFYVFAGVAIVGLQSAMIIGLVFQRAQRRRTEVALRDSERMFRETAERNQDLAGRLINAQEEERSRIARDLHDDISQQIAGFSIMLSGLKKKIGRAVVEPAIDAAVLSLQDRVATLAHGVRNLSHRLHPNVLEHTGLIVALRTLCAEVQKDHGVAVRFIGDLSLESLDAEVALCLFRVAQEALANAVRHAHAGTILVELRAVGDHLEMIVSDDGVGFVVSDRTRTGLGLRSIDERVRLAGGQCTVDSSRSHGTTVRTRVPVPFVQGAC